MATNQDDAAVAMAEVHTDISKEAEVAHHSTNSLPAPASDDGSSITDDDLVSLRRVSGQIKWVAFTIAFVELCERFSYYGTTVVFVNFIQQKLPKGSTTGAGHNGQSGALNMGQRASTGLTTFNQFWAYLTPLLGAYIA
jgi:POT family proton-dependent oligopeptide transporter